MRFTLILFLCLVSAGVASALDIITATVTITNAPTVNGETITVNGNTRTWTNNVQVASSQIATNATIGGSATNLFLQVAANPFTGLSLQLSGTNGISLQSAPGGALAVTLSAGWGTVLLQTNSLTSATAVRVPYTVEGAPQQTNIASGVAAILDASQSTNQVHESAPSMVNFLGNTNTQTVAGTKNFTNAAGSFWGIISNSPAIGGFISSISNGLWRSGILLNPTLTNGINYGNAFRSPGSGTDSEQFGNGATASATRSTAVGKGAHAIGQDSTAVGALSYAGGSFSGAFGSGSSASNAYDFAFGPNSIASGSNSAAIGAAVYASHPNSTVIGYGAASSRAGQVRIGNSALSPDIELDGNLTVTGLASNITAAANWNFPAGSDIAFARYVISSLANGDNADIDVGTNVFVEVSGPTAAFTIHGFLSVARRSGKLLMILNRTGQQMTIANESGTEGTANRRIQTGTGGNRTSRTNGIAAFLYDTSASRWVLTELDNESLSVSSFNGGNSASTSTFLRGDGTWATPSISGATVSSVGLTMPSIFSVSGSPVTSSGTLGVTLGNESANTVFAGPGSGGAAGPTFRALVANDYPTMIGDGGSGGTKGAVPAPSTGDATHFLRGDGTWSAVAGASGGTVTSVAMTGDGIIFTNTIPGSPVTSSGTLVPGLAKQSANTFLGGPLSGAAATPTFRTITPTDIPGSGGGGVLTATNPSSFGFRKTYSMQAIGETTSTTTGYSTWGWNLATVSSSVSVAATSSSPGYLLVYESASANAAALQDQNTGGAGAMASYGKNLVFTFRIALTNTSNVRYQIGVSDTYSTQIGQTQVITNNVIFFTASTNSANWFLTTGDGSGQATTDTGLAISTSDVVLGFSYQVGSQVIGYTNGVACATNTTHLPTGTWTPMLRMQPTTSSTSGFKVYGFYGEQDW